MSPWALVSVVLLLVAFAALSWWLRRMAGGRVGPGLIRVVEQRRLDAQTMVSVVEVDGRRLLLGSGRDGVRLLSELPPTSPSPPTETPDAP